jgi:hypothetical protein
MPLCSEPHPFLSLSLTSLFLYNCELSFLSSDARLIEPIRQFIVVVAPSVFALAKHYDRGLRTNALTQFRIHRTRVASRRTMGFI